VRQRPAPTPITEPAREPQVKDPLPVQPAAPTAQKPRKMSFKDQKELETLPAVIEKLETDIEALNAAMAQPDFYQQSRDDIALAQTRLAHSQNELEAAYARWETLETLRGSSMA